MHFSTFCEFCDATVKTQLTLCTFWWSSKFPTFVIIFPFFIFAIMCDYVEMIDRWELREKWISFILRIGKRSLSTQHRSRWFQQILLMTKSAQQQKRCDDIFHHPTKKNNTFKHTFTLTNFSSLLHMPFDFKLIQSHSSSTLWYLSKAWSIEYHRNEQRLYNGKLF